MTILCSGTKFKKNKHIATYVALRVLLWEVFCPWYHTIQITVVMRLTAIREYEPNGDPEEIRDEGCGKHVRVHHADRQQMQNF